MTLGEMQALFGSNDEIDSGFPKGNHENPSAPDNFDSRTQWPGLVHPIRNQLRCGSCWAFGAAGALSDRHSIFTSRQLLSLSPQDMVSCDTSNFACNGGNIRSAWLYLQNSGVVTEACLPYSSGDGSVEECPNQICKDGS